MLHEATSRSVSTLSSRTVVVKDRKRLSADSKLTNGRVVDQLPSFETNVIADKQYAPDMFSGQHVSEILSENNDLKAKVIV
jgi:hypothetical protein